MLYVLPYGQMSHWGIELNHTLLLLPVIIKRNFQLSTKNNIFKIHSNLLEKFIGVLDGDGYIEIGPQNQYNDSNTAKSIIRMRIVLRLHKDDKELLNLFMTTLKIGKLDELKSKNQYRLILFKTDIINLIFPYLQNNNIEFLNYNRRKQYFLLKYIIENNIKHWENINLEEINNLFQKSNKKLDFTDIIKLPYFNNWLIGFTIAEGSFHIKAKGTAHYSIVQSGHENYNLIKAIHYFIKGPSSFDHKINPEDSKVYRISFSSRTDLTFILNFFENNNLLGLKKIQFDIWKSYVINNDKIISSAPNVLLPKISTNKDLTNTNNNNEPRNE
jgi:hypothetical protein